MTLLQGKVQRSCRLMGVVGGAVEVCYAEVGRHGDGTNARMTACTAVKFERQHDRKIDPFTHEVDLFYRYTDYVVTVVSYSRITALWGNST